MHSTVLTTLALSLLTLGVSTTPVNGNPQCPAGCVPIPGQNQCDVTTSCVNTFNADGQSSGNARCACRAGYRADGLAPTDPKQVRLNFPGQEYRVFVEPGVVCNTLCDQWQLGAQGCQEVPTKAAC